MVLLNWTDSGFSLDLSIMDDTHKEFIELYTKLVSAGDDTFASLFEEFVSHTSSHFLNEDALMEQSKFPSIAEHRADHQRVLNELKYFQEKVRNNKFSFARFFIKDRIPSWFKQHLATMDSALAYHLKTSEEYRVEVNS